MNVSLTPELEAFVARKVESGRYNSASEVVREALRLLEDQDSSREAPVCRVQPRTRPPHRRAGSWGTHHRRRITTTFPREVSRPSEADSMKLIAKRAI